MKKFGLYKRLLDEKGKSLSVINPGSIEMALSLDNALEALELLKKGKAMVVGGDVLFQDSDGLAYAYQILGNEYIYLNWHCNKGESENRDHFSERSYEKARYSELRGMEAGLEAHHVGQRALMQKLVQGYNYRNAPAILVISSLANTLSDLSNTILALSNHQKYCK